MVNKNESKARGRPKSDEKRESILQAAGASFLELGLADTSMDRVAERAGVSKQTVYSHFKNKDALFQAVIRNKCEQFRLANSVSASDAGSMEAGLYEITREYLELALDPEVIAMTRQVAAQSNRSSAMARLFVEAGPQPSIAAFARFLGHHLATGNLHGIDDVDRCAADFVHETAARFKFEMMMRLREEVDDCERDRHARRRVRDFLALHAAPNENTRP
jgi:TetR/AcrR family transcriptional repressor of mexJK operon